MNIESTLVTFNVADAGSTAGSTIKFAKDSSYKESIALIILILLITIIRIYKAIKNNL